VTTGPLRGRVGRQDRGLPRDADPRAPGRPRDCDLAFSNELRIDHSITCPITTLRPQADLPIVPIYTNIFAPPLPQPKRFVAVGRTIRELVESMPGDQRVAVIGTGHLSLELGGPRQFGPHGPDPEFDRKAVEWIATGDLER
jgi:protocatechuate 4,5-dioxygenase beta chain